MQARSAALSALLLALSVSSPAFAEEPGAPPAQAFVGDGETLTAARCFKAASRAACCRDRLVRDPLLCVPGLDPALARLQASRPCWPVRVALGGYHWWNRADDGDVTYGYPGFEGTYYYYAQLDAGGPRCGGPLAGAGAHLELQWRDRTRFRRFYDGLVWLYEAYGWLEHRRLGTLKVGQVRRRFGLDSDGTFWGHLPYYHGQTLDPDWMASWEHTFGGRGRFSLESSVQVLFGEDGVNGSVTGGDAESSSVYDEGLGVNARLVPTLTTETTSLALGFSALAQHVEGDGVPDETSLGFAVDASFEWCGLRVAGAWYLLDGTVHESHYVTGGPTAQKRIAFASVGWTLGSLTPRVSFSHAQYRDPDGWERLWLAGLDLRVTSWLILTLEYVFQEARGEGLERLTLEDGVQLVLNWNV